MSARTPSLTVLNKYTKSIVIFLTVAIYIVGYLLARSHFNSGITGVLTLIPVLAFAWYYGIKKSMFFTFALILFHFLFQIVIFQDTLADLLERFALGVPAVFLVAYVVGYLRETSRKITELREHSSALHLGIERAKDIVFTTDISGKIQYVNPAFTETYGYTEEDWRGKTPRLLKSGKTPPETYEKLWERLKNKESFDYQLVNKTKDGRLLNIESSASPVLDQNDDLIGFLAIQKNVTLQKKIEEDLLKRTKELEETKDDLEERQSELIKSLNEQKELHDKLKKERDTAELIFGSMGEGLLMIDNDYKIELINLKAQYLLGVEKEDVVGKVWADVVKAYIDGKPIPFEERTSVKVLKTGASLITTLDDDHYYSTPSGKKFPVTSVTTPLITDDQVTGVVKVFKDASTEKEAKRIIEEAVKAKSSQLKEEQSITSSILENTGEGVALSDSKGKIEFINPAFTNLTGLVKEDLIGKEFSDAVTAYDLKEQKVKPEDISDAASVTATNKEMKVFLDTSGNGRVAVVINASPVYIEEKYIGVVRVLHDITEEIRLQQQKDDFFSIASHELRTPLTVISGNLDTLLTYSKSDFDENDMEIMEDTVKSSDRLIKLISDYLNVSRLDQGRLKYEIEEIDACKLTKEVVNELKQLTDEKGLKLEYECSQEHRNVMADAGLFKEILINLIGNSIKFTDEGSIKVWHEEQKENLRISVTDTGVGIPKNMQGELFQRFQQAHNRTITRRAGGTGLGLYISREFARKMNGDLILEKSMKDKGSTFTLTLPLAEHANKVSNDNTAV